MKPILLVDDRHDILSFLMWELKQHGILCMQADNSQDALELLSEIEFEAIFLDIVLGQDNSTPIVDYIRSEKNILNNSLKVVLMSGLIDKDFTDKHKNKFFKILEKPFVDSEIAEIIREIKET